MVDQLLHPPATLLFQGQPFTSVELQVDDSAESAHVRDLLDSWGVPYSPEHYPGVRPRTPAVRLVLDGRYLIFRGHADIARLFLSGVETHPTSRPLAGASLV